jgi:glycosyltransferase involved in cell wall biosynthesis
MKSKRTITICIALFITTVIGNIIYHNEKIISQYMIEKISDYRAKQNKPDISVMMPTYNRVDFLHKAIESILNQTYKNFELIIVDDGSLINNRLVLWSYLIKDSRIRIYFNQNNKGRSFTRNKLLDLSKGKYLAIMDDDDTAYPNRLEEQFSYMSKHQNVDVCISLASFNGNKDRDTNFVGPTQIPEVDLFFTTPFVHPGLMLKKDFIKKHNIRYDESLVAAEDYDFYYQLFINKAKFHTLKQYLMDIRIHKTNSKNYYTKRDENFFKIQKRFQSMFFADNGIFCAITSSKGFGTEGPS